MQVKHVFSPVVLAVVTAALSSCVVGPRFVKPKTDAPAAWNATPDAGSQTVPEPVVEEWWRALGDPTLDALETRAIAANLDLKIAALRLAQSRIQRRAAGADRTPKVDASASYRRERQSETGVGTRVIEVIPVPGKDEIISALSEPFGVYQAGFDASWELDLWGRVKRTIEAADARLEASAETVRDVRRLVASEVARTYVDLRGVQRLLALAQGDETAGRELLELTQQRAAAGLVTDLDVTRQQAQLAEIRSRVPTLEERESQALNRLTLLLGEQPGKLAEELKVARDVPLVPSRVPIGLPADVVRLRPDIRVAEARLHAATAEIGVAIADLYPRITLGGSAGVQSLGVGDLSDWGARTWSLGPILRLPIFDGGRRRAAVELRKAQQQEAAIEFQRTVLQAFHEVDDALTSYAAEQRRREFLGEGVSSSRAAYELARIRYEHGLTDLLVALEAQRNLLATEQAHAESTTAIATRFVALNKALGGGLDVTQDPKTE